MVSDLVQELRYAARRIGRTPGFAALVVLTLALGIGATTGIFSVVNGVLLRPLPYEEPERLAILYGSETGQRSGSSWASYPDFVDFEAQASTLAGLAAWSSTGATMTGTDGEPVRLSVVPVTHDLFPMLGIRAARGRLFLPEEDRLGAEPVAVLSHSLWTARLGADPDMIGRKLLLDGQPHVAIGVLPPDVEFDEGDVFVPLVPRYGEDSRGQHRIVPLARLGPDKTLAEADAEVKAIASRLERQYPEWNTNRGAYLEPLLDVVVGDVRATLWTLLGLVGVVLLIACANVANLLLTRARNRGREVAVRSALGAERRHLLRLLGVEALLLAVLGGTVGVALAFGGLRLLKALAPPDIPRLAEVSLDGRVLVFAAALTLVTGLVCAVLPALHAAGVDLQERLKEGSRSAVAGGRRRLPQAVVVLEVALGVLAVASAGLLVKSFLRLQQVDSGFAAEDVLVMPIALPELEYWDQSDPDEDGRRAVDFFAELERRVEALPGVTSVASAYMHPLSGGWESSFSIPGVLEAPQGQRPEARIRPVTPGYFRTVGMPLLRGRDFTERDRSGAPGVVIVNESFATTFFPGADPLGHRVARSAWWASQPEEFEIVGVVGDVRMDGLAEDVPTALYFPHPQFPFAEMNLVVAGSGDPQALLGVIREQVWSIDPELPVEDGRTLREIRSGSVATERFRTGLVGLFAAVALLLATIGIYGVLSSAVSERTREMGLRMSLGATAADVVRLVARQGMTLVGLGIVVGIGSAILVSRLFASLLFEVSPSDPRTYAGVAAGLALVGLAACLVPAVRAARTDPVIALQAE